MKRIRSLMLLAALALLLSGCHMYNFDYKENVTEFAMIAEDGDLSALDAYPNLEYVDLRGSTCYGAILAYAQSHPDISVRYNVSLGSKRYEPIDTDLELNGRDADFDLLIQNLKYLPNARRLHLNQAAFTAGQMAELTAAYPNISISFCVELSGHKYEHTAEVLDLTYLTASDIDDAIRALSLLPNLRQVNLFN